jgi:hypothetical protein
MRCATVATNISMVQIVAPERPPGFLLQVGRVVTRGSELEGRVREVVAALGPARDREGQPRSREGQAAPPINRVIRDGRLLARRATGADAERIGDWLERCGWALQRRDHVVQSASTSSERRGPVARDSRQAGSTEWTEWSEEKLSVLAADTVELISDYISMLAASARSRGGEAEGD